MDNIIWITFIIFIFYLSIKLMFKQKFRSLNIFSLFKNINKKSMSSLCMFLGTKIGVGTLIGTSISVYLGGSTALIWMIIFTIFTSSIVYEEARLGFRYREKNDNSYISGPNYYINNKFMKRVYIILFIISYTFLFLMIQTNTISRIIDINIFVNKWIIVLFFLILLTLLVNIDLQNIIDILNKLVIFMCILVLVMFLGVVFKNKDNLYGVYMYICNDLFKIKNIMYGIIPSVLLVIKKCVFQTELLLGTTSISASLSEGGEDEAAAIQVLGYYFIMLVCILTGILIILYKMNNFKVCDNYFELISRVFAYHYGNIGVFMLIILFLLFGITTIISAYYFGINNVKKLNRNVFKIYKILMIIFPLCGILINEGIIWNVVDTSLLVLMIINSIWIYKLGK